MKSLKNAFFAFMIAACFMIMAMPVHAQASMALPENLQKLLDQGAVWVGLIILIWEYLLSKTSIVKSNSTIDLIVAGIKKIFGLK